MVAAVTALLPPYLPPKMMVWVQKSPASAQPQLPAPCRPRPCSGRETRAVWLLLLVVFQKVNIVRFRATLAILCAY